MLKSVDGLIKKSEEERDKEITKAKQTYEHYLKEKERMKHDKYSPIKIKEYYLDVVIPVNMPTKNHKLQQTKNILTE